MRIEPARDETIRPRCPACREPIDRLLSVPARGGLFNQSNVVVCPHCHVIIGYGKVNYF